MDFGEFLFGVFGFRFGDHEAMPETLADLARAKTFAEALIEAIRAQGPGDLWRTTSGSTVYMTGRLAAVAQAHNRVICASTLGAWQGERLEHEPREYLFDVTIYREREDYALPEIVIEHENSHRPEAFLFDFWKLMMGYARLRVMIGYAAGHAERDALAASIVSPRIKAPLPAGTEDLVMIGRRGMAPDEWLLLSRRGSDRWLMGAPGQLSALPGHPSSGQPTRRATAKRKSVGGSKA